jgi:hypothetical protein
LSEFNFAEEALQKELQRLESLWEPQAASIAALILSTPKSIPGTSDMC